MIEHNTYVFADRTLELDIVAQDYLDTYNWYGTLMAIALILPPGEEKEKIEKAIAALEPEPSIQQAIQDYGLDKVIESLLASAEITGHKIKCPSEVEEILTEIDDERRQRL